jgi:predicted tellurium resistance membrane protein TerC
MDLSFLSSPDTWIALLTLTFLEIVLGIDNIIFISIVTGKLPPAKRKKATRTGLFLAMFLRIGLLFGITVLTRMKTPWVVIDLGWFSTNITGQGLILLLGGLFLIYKSTKEIHEKVDTKGEHESELKVKAKTSYAATIAQILLIDLIFSIDSILTAVGMTNGASGALPIMVAAVVISVGIMMLFAVPVGSFVNSNPSIQILGLSFLILIGFMLIIESMHLGGAQLAGQHVGEVPKGYLYFAIAFSLAVEFLNMKMRKKTKA